MIQDNKPNRLACSLDHHPVLPWIVIATLIAVFMTTLFFINIRKQPSDPSDPIYWIEKLNKGELHDRRAAVSILSAVRPKTDDIRSALIEVLTDPDPGIRFAAIAGLHDELDAYPQIEILTQDQVPFVRSLERV